MKNENVMNEIEMCNSILKKLEEDYKDCKNDYEFLKNNDDNSEECNLAKKAVMERYSGLKTTIDAIKERLEILKNK